LKVVKVLLGIVLLGVVALLGVGLATPEFEYANKVTIDKPVNVVWSVFTDPARMKEWLHGLVKVEVLAGKPLEVGSKFRLEFDSDGHQVIVDETVVAVEPAKRYAFDVATDVFEGLTDISFFEVNGKTEVEAKSKVVGANVFMRAILRMAKPKMIEESQKSYDALRRVCEGTP